MTDHPTIVPPPELIAKWMTEARFQDYCSITEQVAYYAAQWGADQELEACCGWLVLNGYGHAASKLRAARRPKPPTLAEQGMEALRSTPCTEQRHYDALFAALNRLAELEDSNG